MEKKSSIIKHWADAIAEEIISRVKNDSFLQKVVEKNGYLVYDEKTPSGRIHIGSGRGWVIHDVIAKALRDKGADAIFVLSSDDMDPMDKLPRDLPREYEKYLGIPFRHIPSPVEGYESYGDYFFRQATEKFDEFGINAVLESTGEEYEKGSFNNAISIALNNAEKIQQIYRELYGKDTVGANRLPFNPICEKCGKIGTTQAFAWDPKTELIRYRCSPDFVEWAAGCGHEGKRSPYNGAGKFPWKVEWAAKWPTKGVIAETAGKDHFTKGGSRTIACRIAMDVFNFPPPWPSKGYNTGKGYEFFTVGGKKMSTSKGRGLSFAESTKYAPASILRFLLVRTRPNAVIDFQPYDSNDLILLFDRYDRVERAYFGKEEVGEKEHLKQKRIYELSHVGPLPEEMPPQVSFKHLAVLAQIFPEDEKVIKHLQETGHLPKTLHREDEMHVKERLDFARKWVLEFAEEQYKFQLQESIPKDAEFSEKEREALHLAAKRLRKKKFSEEELFEEFYEIAKDIVDISPKQFFKAAYRALIGKDKGPRLAPFVLSAKEQAIKLFEQV